MPAYPPGLWPAPSRQEIARTNSPLIGFDCLGYWPAFGLVIPDFDKETGPVDPETIPQIFFRMVGGSTGSALWYFARVGASEPSVLFARTSVTVDANLLEITRVRYDRSYNLNTPQQPNTLYREIVFYENFGPPDWSTFSFPFYNYVDDSGTRTFWNAKFLTWPVEDTLPGTVNLPQL